MAKQARFWTYIRSEPTLLKLVAGQTVSHREGGATDEGWSWTLRTWAFDGEFVTLESDNRSSDCDGPHEHHDVVRCSVAELRAGYTCPDHPTITYPVWREVSSRQRDIFAERMGY